MKYNTGWLLGSDGGGYVGGWRRGGGGGAAILASLLHYCGDHSMVVMPQPLFLRKPGSTN